MAVAEAVIVTEFIFEGKDGSKLHLQRPFLNNQNHIEFLYVPELAGKAQRVWIDMKESKLFMESGTGKKVSCVLSQDDEKANTLFNEVNTFYLDTFNILKGFSDRMAAQSEFLHVYIEDGKCVLFLPETMVEHSEKSSKFIAGFVYYMNKMLGTKHSYDELQSLFVDAYKEQTVQGKDSLRLSVAALVMQTKK